MVGSTIKKKDFEITVRPFVSEISSFKCKRILFHSITDIDATTGRTANQNAVLISGGNFLQDSVMLFWKKKVFHPKRSVEKNAKKVTFSIVLIDLLDGISGPIDQNLEKIQGTNFSYLSQRNLRLLGIQLSLDSGPTIIQHEAVTVYNSVNKKVKDIQLHQSTESAGNSYRRSPDLNQYWQSSTPSDHE
ncbi:hypothetical protein PV328_004012 [Microctonus aethiopoides]|uniref:Uncharacterized protein n=1 Tax=Microctonus aethiopoides TaxID=144406 RepID=A0AA39KL51_9HYME|nr:hypothetical protein PV328_004012 [Microctonus aethiopoides]